MRYFDEFYYIDDECYENFNLTFGDYVQSILVFFFSLVFIALIVKFFQFLGTIFEKKPILIEIIAKILVYLSAGFIIFDGYQEPNPVRFIFGLIWLFHLMFNT